MCTDFCTLSGMGCMFELVVSWKDFKAKSKSLLSLLGMHIMFQNMCFPKFTSLSCCSILLVLLIVNYSNKCFAFSSVFSFTYGWNWCSSTVVFVSISTLSLSHDRCFSKSFFFPLIVVESRYLHETASWDKIWQNSRWIQ